MHVLFFFKQKTAYEMRISDWSSDVCSSDLGKRLPIRQSKIVVQFRGVPHSIFETRGTALKPNRLIIRLQPEESISLLMMAKQPGLDRDGIQLREVPLDLSLTTALDRKSTRLNSSH